jgi:hypothetical protein
MCFATALPITWMARLLAYRMDRYSLAFCVYVHLMYRMHTRYY